MTKKARFTLTNANHEIQEFSTFIAYQMLLEAEKTFNRAFHNLRL